MEECDQKKLRLAEKFGIPMPGLDTYFLEVSTHGLLKVATKSSFGGKLSKKIAFLSCFSEAKTEK